MIKRMLMIKFLIKSQHQESIANSIRCTVCSVSTTFQPSGIHCRQKWWFLFPENVENTYWLLLTVSGIAVSSVSEKKRVIGRAAEVND